MWSVLKKIVHNSRYKIMIKILYKGEKLKIHKVNSIIYFTVFVLLT